MSWLLKAKLQDAPVGQPNASTNAFIGPDGTFYPIPDDHGHDRWVMMYLNDETSPLGKPWIRQKAFDKLLFEYSGEPSDAQWSTMSQVILQADGYSEVILSDTTHGYAGFSVNEFRQSGLTLKNYLDTIGITITDDGDAPIW